MASVTAALRPTACGTLSAAERLERGEILTFATCPFPLPHSDERTTLFEQHLDAAESKYIGYDPRHHRAFGFVQRSAAETKRLADTLGSWASQATRWLSALLPRYAAACELDYVAFHPEEEATRKLRLLDRNDLLHIDAAPAHPTHGRRLLRLFVNLHPTDPRVWQTSLSFAELFERFGADVGLPAPATGPWWRPLRQGLLRLLQPARPLHAPYDDFMLRFHDFLKRHESFQERTPKRCWHFVPGSAWLAFTDGVSHAELRGRFVLECAFFIARQGLACPELAPFAHFQRASAPSSNSLAA